MVQMQCYFGFLGKICILELAEARIFDQYCTRSRIDYAHVVQLLTLLVAIFLIYADLVHPIVLV